ncbi:phosphoribosylglycinamide formyltransferase [Schaalia hyovaginalis]|uniref:Phosphoribosylglycinamide formyltransferase n=1 Tax=Schaalia hyovaginalis TaxID=29316 RepID=A0A923E5S9_9ACTO|nr:phosphoribosylglycinamide formyltransferase [Schaalia hyovaginalis]MBB6334141.1 phosphoribosylglycinamide formyltransferase-1 [Schaalia hyovaginalis]MDY2669482.1 phosphoribosylglycinamide formyltransferase [Schaalia hyovaginalis]
MTVNESESVHAPIPDAGIAVLVSGEGSNMRALVAAAEEPAWGGGIACVLADRRCAAIDWADAHRIPTRVLKLKDHPDRRAWDLALVGALDGFEPDLVVSAGFLKLLGPAVLTRYEGRILNTHNSLLPAFPGVRGPADALESGVKIAGATLFFVDAGTDTGPIIAQTAVPVEDDDTPESLLERIKSAERVQLVESIGCLIREGWTIRGRRVRFGQR